MFAAVMLLVSGLGGLYVGHPEFWVTVNPIQTRRQITYAHCICKPNDLSAGDPQLVRFLGPQETTLHIALHTIM